MDCPNSNSPSPKISTLSVQEAQNQCTQERETTRVAKVGGRRGEEDEKWNIYASRYASRSAPPRRNRGQGRKGPKGRPGRSRPWRHRSAHTAAASSALIPLSSMYRLSLRSSRGWFHTPISLQYSSLSARLTPNPWRRHRPLVQWTHPPVLRQ